MNMRIKSLLIGCLTAATVLCCGQYASAWQGIAGPQFEVNESVESLNVIAGSARRLKFAYQVPELMVENPEVIQASPVSPNEILITGLKPGVSSITISDPDKNLQTVAVEVLVDTRKLDLALSNFFPDSQIEVHPLNSGVILAGHVARADQVANIMSVARDFFPDNVVNQLAVNGNQNIAIKVDVYEVSRTKLRQLGVDWAILGRRFNAVSSISDIIQAVSDDGEFTVGEQNLSVGVIGSNGNQFRAFVRALERNDIAKLLDQPVLVAQNGRPAEFLSGGEIPILVPSGLGTTSIEFRPFGTKLDMVPIVHGNGELTLEVRAEVSEVAPELATDAGVPGFRVRRVNTGVKMRAGHTLALAGDYKESSSGENQGVPKLKHSGIFGPLFRQVQIQNNETELVFLITPQFVSDVEPGQMPAGKLGQLTANPSNVELYKNGHLEVPVCQEDCPVDDSFGIRGVGAAQGQMNYPAMPAQGMQYQGMPMGRSAPQTTDRHANNGFSWPSPNQR
jgi:pilus assembly protein CpaC